MKWTVTMELCMPPREAVERLRRAAHLSFWSEQQRRELHIRQDLSFFADGNVVRTEHPALLPTTSHEDYLWDLRATLQDVDGGCRVSGVLECAYPRDVSVSWSVVLFIVVFAPCMALLTLGGRPAVSDQLRAFVIAGAVAAIPAAIATWVQWVAVERQAAFMGRGPEAFLRVVFEGGIKTLAIRRE